MTILASVWEPKRVINESKKQVKKDPKAKAGKEGLSKNKFVDLEPRERRERDKPSPRGGVVRVGALNAYDAEGRRIYDIVCMYVCTYVRTSACMHACMYVCTYVTCCIFP